MPQQQALIGLDEPILTDEVSRAKQQQILPHSRVNTMLFHARGKGYTRFALRYVRGAAFLSGISPSQQLCRIFAQWAIEYMQQQQLTCLITPEEEDYTLIMQHCARCWRHLQVSKKQGHAIVIDMWLQRIGIEPTVMTEQP